MNKNKIKELVGRYAEENYHNEYEKYSFYEGANFVIDIFYEDPPLVDFVKKNIGKEFLLCNDERVMLMGYNKGKGCVIAGRYNEAGWDKEYSQEWNLKARPTYIDQIFIDSPMIKSYWYVEMERIRFI